ncbi:MAG: hypothetical protein A2Y80_09135 [Deltaproteobacteria bacterium RBG_13_58_19]|nr:MAG: hypothetical protein A2Y80_09135 [Deltaproteobacteria bacterium RBG_13_58_19]
MTSSKLPNANDKEKEIDIRRISAGIREEEVCRILNLKKNLDYSDVLIKYTSKYLRLGWDLVAVNYQGEAHLGLDFKQPAALWHHKLTEMGLEGVHVNIGLRTGSLSGLLVLEVHRQESLFPFNQPGDWCSDCVAEVGLEREQHYYLLPEGWQPPSSFFLNSFQIMVFGEGGVVLTPPSVEPRAQTNLRWLRAPWESSPSRLSQILGNFLRKNAPTIPEAPVASEPTVAAWAEIYQIITSYPVVFQALLAPAASPESYYQNLLEVAGAAGLEDPQVLLGLLWHAPLGDARNNPQRWQSLKNLVRLASGRAPASDPSQAPEGSSLSPGADTGERPDDLEFPDPFASLPHDLSSDWPGPETEPQRRRAAGRQLPPEAASEPWTAPVRLPQDSLLVDRHRYEAMIYELGKLGAWQEIYAHEHQENKALKKKVDANLTKELNLLRQLSSPKDKKGWYRRWRKD